MLHGHVDEISRSLIDGCAADNARSNERIDISILVNGRNVAQVCCNLPREDLAGTGQYGDGNYGFSFPFAKPLPAEAVHLSIRFSRSGAPLVVANAC